MKPRLIELKIWITCIHSLLNYNSFGADRIISVRCQAAVTLIDPRSRLCSLCPWLNQMIGALAVHLNDGSLTRPTENIRSSSDRRTHAIISASVCVTSRCLPGRPPVPNVSLSRTVGEVDSRTVITFGTAAWHSANNAPKMRKTLC